MAELISNWIYIINGWKFVDVQKYKGIDFAGMNNAGEAFESFLKSR